MRPAIHRFKPGKTTVPLSHPVDGDVYLVRIRRERKRGKLTNRLVAVVRRQIRLDDGRPKST